MCECTQNLQVVDVSAKIFQLVLDGYMYVTEIGIQKQADRQKDIQSGRDRHRDRQRATQTDR